jgi:hypothetical protein
MIDIEYEFVEEQRPAIERLADESDILSVTMIDPRTFIFEYDCNGLIALRDGTVRRHTGFKVCCHLNEGYLRRVDPLLLLNLRDPPQCYHPSVSWPLICVGKVIPGTPLVDLCARAYELISYQSFPVAEGDALRPDACAYVRANLDRFPVDARPLKWRKSAVALADPGARP